MRNDAWSRSFAVLASMAAWGWCVGCGSSSSSKNDGSAAGSGGHGWAGGIGGAGAGGGTVDGASSGAGALMSDGQIAGVMLEANTGEVSAALIALADSANATVTTFATMIVTDHKAANSNLVNIVRQDSITVAGSAVRQMLSAEASRTLSALISTPPSTFDATYVLSQVTIHTMVLQLLDDQLIPKVEDASLKTELQSERATVMNHLTAAQQLLNGNGGGDADRGN